MGKSMENNADVIMKKVEQFLESLHERKSDTLLIKKIVNHLKDPYGLPVDLATDVHIHSMCNNLEYIIKGEKGKAEFDESIYFIQGYKKLCRYSVKYKCLIPLSGGIFTFQNRVYCFKVFNQG